MFKFNKSDSDYINTVESVLHKNEDTSVIKVYDDIKDVKLYLETITKQFQKSINESKISKNETNLKIDSILKIIKKIEDDGIKLKNYDSTIKRFSESLKVLGKDDDYIKFKKESDKKEINISDHSMIKFTSKMNNFVGGVYKKGGKDLLDAAGYTIFGPMFAGLKGMQGIFKMIGGGIKSIGESIWNMIPFKEKNKKSLTEGTILNRNEKSLTKGIILDRNKKSLTEGNTSKDRTNLFTQGLIEYFDKHALKSVFWNKILGKISGESSNKIGILGIVAGTLAAIVGMIGAGLLTGYGLYKMFPKFFTKLSDYVFDVFGRIPNMFDSVVNFIKEKWKIILGVVFGAVGYQVLIVSKLYKIFSAGFIKLKDYAFDVFENISKMFSSMIDWMKEKWQVVIEKIKGFAKGVYEVPGKIKEGIKSTVKNVRDFGSGIILGGVDKVKDFFKQDKKESVTSFGINKTEVGGTTSRYKEIHSPREIVKMAEISQPVVTVLDKMSGSMIQILEKIYAKLEVGSTREKSTLPIPGSEVNINSIPSMIDDLGIILLNSGVV